MAAAWPRRCGATGLGAASSSCSYAAVAIAKSVFQKGAGLPAAVAFMFASTNLVFELGIVIWIFLGPAFTAAEFAGGFVLISLMWAAVHLFVSDHEEERAREHAREAATGHEHTIAVMAAAPAAAELRVIARRATWALAAREMRRVLGLWAQTVLPPVVTGVIFLAIFGGALSDRLPAVSGVAYVRFILPGLLVMTVAGQAFANNSTSLVQARTRATSRTC